ncbi:MAG TPA: hypothetical protein DCF84_08385 [Bacteroidetes bacterium]|nr:hypothetical protein [Bacteroidota bacterium]
MRWYSFLLLTFLIGLLFVQTSPAIKYTLTDADSYEDIDSQGQEKEGQENEQEEKEGEEKESEKFLEWQVGLPSEHPTLYTSNHVGANRLYHSLYIDIIIPPPDLV